MIDAHHHIWRQVDLPWLQGEEKPRIFGSYRPIMRDYMIPEYLDDIAGTGIEKSVYVQANWPPQKFAEEVAWVQSVADESGWPHAIVGYADMTSEEAGEQLRWLSTYPLMRGIRQQLHWHDNPAYRFADRPDLPADPTVQRNVARLADYGWTFDLQVFSGQMGHAVLLARACPAVTFILQHAGMLEDQSTEGWAQWREGMKQLADCPNVVTKLSAFGTFIHRNDPEFIAGMISETVAIFGADRCMYGSNFPIEKIWTSYREMFAAFSAATAHFSQEQQYAIFKETASRVYRL